MRKRTSYGVALAFLLLFSIVLVFENELPEAKASLLSDDLANINNWSIVNGVWTSADSVLQGTSTIGGEGLIWAGSTSWINYRVTANLRVVNSADASIVLRYNGPSDFYYLGLGCWGHKYSISKVVNGVYQELTSYGFASELEVGRWYLVSAVAIDGMLQLFVDGTNVLQVQDYSLSKGAVGFRDWAGTMQVECLNVESKTWSKTYGGYCGIDVVQTLEGGFAMVGYISGYGVCLVKTDSSGNLLWNRTYGGAQGRSVVQTLDGGFAIAGYTVPLSGTNGGVYLVKTDSAGNLLWNRTYEGVNGDSVVQTLDGGFAIVGMTFPIGGNGNDVCFVKTDSSGNLLWNKTYGGTGTEEGYSVVQTLDGGFAIAGYTVPLSGTNGGVYLVKTNSAGNLLWNRTYGGAQGRCVVQTLDGGFAITGNSEGGPYLVKTDSAGNMLWNKTYGGTEPGGGFSVLQTTDGGFAIAGTYYSGLPHASYGEYLVKTDSSGNMLWNKTYEKPSSTFGGSIVQTFDGGFAIAYNQPAELIKVPSDDPPFTANNYDRLWHTSDFTITLTALDDEFTTVGNTYYRTNDGSINNVINIGQPVIGTEGKNNKLEYWSVDSLGNVEPHHTLTGIKLDKTTPTGSIVIKNDDLFTASTVVTLTLTSNDQTSGVSLVRYSNDGIWDTETWESATAAKAWTITSGDGTKTVYYQVKDNAGLLSSTYSDAIILETYPTQTPDPTPNVTSTPIPTPTPTQTQTPSPTQTPTSTPTPTPSHTPIPTSSPTPRPSPSQSPTPTLNSTPTTSLTPNHTPIQTPNLTEIPTSATPIPNASQIQLPSPSSLSTPTATPLYLYVLVVISITAISATIVLIIKKRW